MIHVPSLLLGAIVAQMVLLIVLFFGGFVHVPSSQSSTVQLYIEHSSLRDREANALANDAAAASLPEAQQRSKKIPAPAVTSIRPSQQEMDEYETQFPKLIYDGKRKECDETRCVIFMHIGKTGGMSFNKWAKKFAASVDRPYHGRHLDWSFVRALGDNTDVITLLRNPISRAISHYYFVQGAPWGNQRLRNMTTLTDYFQNRTFMLETRDIWQDGQAAVSWFTGTHIASWVGTPASQIKKRETLAVQNITMLLHLAADRLEKTLWFGILEDLDRSMELLQHVLGLEDRPFMDPSVNAHKKEHPKTTTKEKEALATLMPQDMWLYEYGRRLFEARWNAYKTGQNKLEQMPDRPPIPEIACTSTRFTLTCKSGSFQGMWFWKQ